MSNETATTTPPPPRGGDEDERDTPVGAQGGGNTGESDTAQQSDSTKPQREDDAAYGYDFELKEQDRWLPIANVARIMKTALPENAKISKEAKECMQECVSEFISFITSEASEKCQQEKRKTVNGEDIIFAMLSLGFENYSEIMKTYLMRYREHLVARGEGGHHHHASSSAAGATVNVQQHQQLQQVQMPPAGEASSSEQQAPFEEQEGGNNSAGAEGDEDGSERFGLNL